MITATFTERAKILSLRVEGHAGYAEHGSDIVCASASILAYTLASIVVSFNEIEHIIELTSGDTTIDCKCKDDKTYDKVSDAYHYTKIGFALLAHNYPQHVRLIES